MSLLDTFGLRRAPDLATAATNGNTSNGKVSKPPGPTDKPPRGASGRGHSGGFISVEEHNTDLMHPQGAQIYDKMFRTDSDIRQVIQLSCNPITGGTWEIEPYGGEEASDQAQEHAEFVRWALWEQMTPNLVGHLIEFLPVLFRSGFAPGECVWKVVKWKGEDRVVLRKIDLRLPRTIAQFEQDAYGELTRIKQYLPSARADLVRRELTTPGAGGGASSSVNETEIWMDAANLVYYRIGAEGDNWEGVSLLRPAYKHWRYKDVIEKIDAIAQEREALGVPVAYPPSSATSEQLDAMEDILLNLRTNDEGYILAPGPKAGQGFAPEGQGWIIEILGYDRTGSGRDPQPSLAYHSQKISAAFIAEFMKLGHGQTGARATAQVQADPFLMSIEALATIVEQQLEKIVEKLITYNFPGVTDFPKLKMSLVDATNLAQLADYVLKLIQIGAMFPDQRLENFLRARADLPPADPSDVKKRGDKDADMRREVVVPPAPDPFGANTSTPGKEHGKGVGGVKDAPGTKPGGATGGSNRGRKDGGKKGLSADVGPGGTRWRKREPRDYERIVDLDGMEDELDEMPERMVRAARAHVVECARIMASDDDGGFGEGAPFDAIRSIIHTELSAGYDAGARHVDREIRELAGQAGTVALDRGAKDRGGALPQRAQVATEAVQLAMRQSLLGADLYAGDRVLAQQRAEAAGVAAMRRVGYDHGVSALLHGRHDHAKTLADEDNGIYVAGARYSSLLDSGTCGVCEECDDGVVRPLDDPVRLDRQPPNHRCESTASGHNRCRCFEVYDVIVK